MTDFPLDLAVTLHDPEEQLLARFEPALGRLAPRRPAPRGGPELRGE